MKQKLLNSFKLRAVMLVAILCAGFTSAWADDVTDVITASDLAATSTTYTDFSNVSKTSDAVYAGQSSKDNSGNIQMRSKNSNSGIVSTTSGGTVKSVKITVGSGSNTVDVYGSNTAYAAASDLYNANKQGTKIGSVTATGTITFTDDYKYVGIRSNNGAIYLSSIEIVWETGGGSGSSDPIQLSAPELAATANNGSVTLEWNAINNASSYTIQYADNESFTGATTLTDATSPKEISGLTNGTTYYFKAMTVGDGTNYLSSDYGDAVSATPANVSKITITQDKLTDFTNTYAWYDWTAGGVSGSAYVYKNSGMQFNSSKDGYWIYNTTAIPGTITSVKMVKASGTDRSWTLKAGTSEISSTDDGTQIGEAQTVGTSGATWNVNGSYNYFCLIVSGGSTVIQSIEITYIPSTDPIIVASVPSVLAYDATGGEFDYSITNPTSATLSATSDAAWITNVTVDGTNSKVTFNTSANEATTQRQGTITLSYTGATDKVVTITQAAAPVIYTTIPALFDAATSTETEVNVNFGGWVVSAVHNNNAYLTDNQGNGLIIYANEHGFQVNDVLTGTVSCKLVLYRGSAELKNLTTSTEGLTVTKNGTVTAQTIAISELSGVNTGALLSFEGLTYNGTALVDGNSNTITPYNTLYSEMSFESEKSYDVTGIYLQYSTTKEILPRSADDIEEVTEPFETVTVSEVGYGTYASDHALDFEGSDIKAFYATLEGSTLTFHEISKVPANTGVLLYANGGESVDILFAEESEVETVTGNVFVRGTGESVTWTESDQKYVLFNGDDGIGFYKANNNNVATNRAYVQVPAGTQVKSFAINLDDTDAIGAIKAVNDNADIFNLAGQRVNKAQKGVYIVNGKKVLVK